MPGMQAAGPPAARGRMLEADAPAASVAPARRSERKGGVTMKSESRRKDFAKRKAAKAAAMASPGAQSRYAQRRSGALEANPPKRAQPPRRRIAGRHFGESYPALAAEYGKVRLRHEPAAESAGNL